MGSLRKTMKVPIQFQWFKSYAWRSWYWCAICHSSNFSKLYGIFLLMGFNCLKAIEPLRGSSLLFTRANRIGQGYTDLKTKQKCKSIIISFTAFRYRTGVYGAKKNLKKGVNVHLDLTKRMHKLVLRWK